MIEADGKTRCPNIPTTSSPGSPPTRCRKHHKQYRTMCKAYKDASRIVDEMEMDELPSKHQIASYEDVELTTKKAS